MNYVTYVNMVRIVQAIQMLSTNQYRMIDIALECGFSNIPVFERFLTVFLTAFPVKKRAGIFKYRVKTQNSSR